MEQTVQKWLSSIKQGAGTVPRYHRSKGQSPGESEICTEASVIRVYGVETNKLNSVEHYRRRSLV